MSQPNNPPALPPPPPTPRIAVDNNGSFFPPRRERPAPAAPQSITTHSLGLTPASTPISSGGNGTPFPLSPNTPVSYTPRTPSALDPASLGALAPPRSPNPAMEPYNPRQWNQSRQMSGSQMVFGRSAGSTREASGMEEAMPSPPPPYSPQTPGTASNRTSMVGSLLDTTNFTASPLPADSARSSPQVPQSPAFPPPPSQSGRQHRDRSTSGLSGPRALLAGLRSKQPAANDHGTVGHIAAGPAVQLTIDTRPPASRRAASTGHLQSASTPISQTGTSFSGRSSPENAWQPGMPLPGPPPGPPPPGTRSQSLNRYPTSSSTQESTAASASHNVLALRRRTAALSELGPIPPTPADWVEGQDYNTPTVSAPIPSHGLSDWQPLRIDTGASRDTSITRRPATRDPSARGLRERRSLSRQARDRVAELSSPASGHSNRSDQVFSPIDGAISHRRAHTRNVSRYGSAVVSGSSSEQEPSNTSNMDSGNPASMLTPPYTPAVKQSDSVNTAPPPRPVSHLLHEPNEEAVAAAPLNPSRPGSSMSTSASSRLDNFALQALERHKAFIEKEAAASSDEERLELFANFMVHESRLRRDRYAAAYNAMASDILDMTRDMWRSYSGTGKRAVTPSTTMSSYDPTVPSWASDGQPASARGFPGSASSFGENTPATDVASLGDAGEAFDRAESKQWPETFKPTLSPIPSMAQSTVPDEESSRGRAPSRWWESSHSSGSIGRPDRIEKSHRETKYMGIRAAELQDASEPSTALSRQSATPGASAQTFSESEYPPEKVGWHESADFETPVATPAKTSDRRSSGSCTGNLLDVSRLITLPPPYPRHHPAVSNSHPALSGLRTEHRTLADRSQVQQIKDAFSENDHNVRTQQLDTAKERRAKLRMNIQSKVADGTISYAEAAQAESDFDAEEAERGKANARANFDRYETHVAQPINTLLSDRIAQADKCFNELKADLRSYDQIPDPNRAQEEGDEQPERLEKLTLLKWLFEAREQLHRQMFDLHAERSVKYSEVILTPYQIQRAQAKIDEATSFFAKDSWQRQTTYTQESQKRFDELQKIMERNVSRGVEDQLSAFWDIAPGLLEVIAWIPDDLSKLEIAVPVSEYEENPSYDRHPLQYLYTLLSHAGKSAYQFIESQINLLCLLHEVRTAATKARLKEGMSDEDLAKVEQELTEDLKEKVGEVEAQWRDALGHGLKEMKGRVRVYLEETGGWEDGLDE